MYNTAWSVIRFDFNGVYGRALESFQTGIDIFSNQRSSDKDSSHNMQMSRFFYTQHNRIFNPICSSICDNMVYYLSCKLQKYQRYEFKD